MSYQVHALENVLGLYVPPGEMPKLIPTGPVFDTKDAATLYGSSRGWMDLWWCVKESSPSSASGGT